MAFIWTVGYVHLETQLMVQLTSSTVRLNSFKKKIECLFADPYLTIQVSSFSLRTHCLLDFLPIHCT